METVKKINDDVNVLRVDDNKLILAKFESIQNESIIQDRIDLINLLRDSSFPCPGIETVDDCSFRRVENGFVFYQEYIDFECVDQGNWYNTQKIEDSILWRSDKLTHLCSFRLPHPIGVCFFFQVAPLVGQSFKHGALFAKFSPVVSMAQTGVNSGGTNGLDQENPEFMRMNFSFGG